MITIYFFRKMIVSRETAKTERRYRVRVRARVNGDVAQMVSALAWHTKSIGPGFESRHLRNTFQA